MSVPAEIDVIRSSQRYTTENDWLRSRHSFSFGDHYDSLNTHFGLLLVNNDDTVKPESGFGDHEHYDTEIITWVLSGSLVHTDSEGNKGEIRPGIAQRISAGTGITHSEKNEGQESAHFIQMWVAPDELGIEPGFERVDVSEQLDGGEWVVIASGLRQHQHDAAIKIHQKHAGLLVARIQPGESLQLPEAAFVHVFMAGGHVDLERSEVLNQGDAARILGGGPRVKAGPAGAEVLVWQMTSALPVS